MGGMNARIPLFVIVFALATHSHAQLSTEAAGTLTKQINEMNTLMMQSRPSDYVDTLVLPTNDKDAVLVCSIGASQGNLQNVDEADRLKVLASVKVSKQWYLTAACAVVQYYKENAGVSVKEITFADVNDLKQKPIRYAVLPLEVAKHVQAEMVNERMSSDTGMSKIFNALEVKSADEK